MPTPHRPKVPLSGFLCVECGLPIVWDYRRGEWQHARKPALTAERKDDR